VFDRLDLFDRFVAENAALLSDPRQPNHQLVHHVLPAEWSSVEEVVPQSFGGLVMIGLDPCKLNLAALQLVNTVCALDEQPAHPLRSLCEL
jgi:hypothetical protein